MRRMAPQAGVRWLAAPLVVAACVLGPRAPAQPPADVPRSAGAALRQVIVALEAEAQRAMTERRLPRLEADYASTYPRTLPDALVLKALGAPIARDPFIDAYVRWQLTSFQPNLDALADAQFEQLLTKLPPLLENPRAERALIDMLNRALRAGILSTSDQARVNAQFNDLATRASETRALNAAALGLRDWLQSQCPDTGLRTLQCGLERCAALVEAGWPVESVKSDVDKRFAASAEDPGFTVDERRRIARQARRLIGARRVLVAEARLEHDRVAVTFDDAGIYDFDVNRWLRLIDPD